MTDKQKTANKGTTFHFVRHGLEAFTHSLADQFPGGNVIAVCHGGVIADFLLNIFSRTQLAEVHEAFSVDPYSGDVIQECSITTV